MEKLTPIKCVGKEKLFFREKYANYKNVEGMTK
jgi:hypothetical protein